MLYSILLGDYFIFSANMFGIPLAFFYSMTGLVLLEKRSGPGDSRTTAILEGILVGGIFLYILVGLVIGIVLIGNDYEGVRKSIVGTCAIIFLMAYYAAPCSTLLEVPGTVCAIPLSA